MSKDAAMLVLLVSLTLKEPCAAKKNVLWCVDEVRRLKVLKLLGSTACVQPTACAQAAS
jgi:hypothetical protein